MTRPLAVGVQLPEVEREVRFPELAALARQVESAGFDSIWLGDHLLYRDADGAARGPWEAWTSLAALAEATERVVLGPLVASTSFHTPPMLAKLAATVDEISGGRLVLGLGAGWNEVEYRAFGFPYDHRASRFEEAFGILRRLMAGERVDHRGEYYEVEGAELQPAPVRRVPIMVGSIGPRVLAATLPHVEAWNAWYAWYGNTVDGARDLLGEIDGRCAAVGRDPATLDKTLAVHVAAPGGTGRVYGADTHAGVAPISGPPAAIAAHLVALAELGVAHVQLVVDPIDEGGVAWAAGILDAF
ncbi:MAG: LLM class flavin-dependent oxidoreductase [Acidimicrobiia bacterium]|nr:LLM class flavin-dependent oxidoreductase [Acidimicrobiia bacterium]